MRRAANRMDSIQCRSRIRCDAGSSASAVLVAAVSCSAAGLCPRRAAWHWPSRRPECARLLRASAARGIQKVAAASWREYLLFLLARFLPAGNVVYRVAVAPFPRRRDAQCLGPMDVREMARSKTRVTSRFLFGKRLHDFFRSDGDFINPHPDGIVDGVRDRGHDRQARALADFFCVKKVALIMFF